MRGRDRAKYIIAISVLLVALVSFIFFSSNFTGLSVFEKRHQIPLDFYFESNSIEEVDLEASPTSLKLSGSYTGSVKIFVKERKSETGHLIFDSSQQDLGSLDSDLLGTITGNAVQGERLFFIDSCVDTCQLSNFQSKIDLIVQIEDGSLDLDKLMYTSNPLVNNPPKIVEGLDSIPIKKGGEVSFSLEDIFVDADADELIYLASDVEGLQVRIVGNELRIKAADNIKDDLELNLKATDLKDSVDANIKLILVEGSTKIDLENLEVNIRDKYQRKKGIYELVPRLDGKLDLEISTLTEEEKISKEIYGETPEIEIAERLLGDEVELKIRGMEETVSDKVDVKIDDGTEQEANLKTKIVAVEGVAKFEKAEITLPKSDDVTKIFHCKDFDNELFVCLSKWKPTEIPFVDNGDSISFEVEEFSAYAGGLVEVINVQSYPTVGGYWTVRFNTTGVEDLTITPINGTTFTETPTDDPLTEDDLDFFALRCGSQDVPYQEITNGSRLISIFVPNYNCSYESTETSLVLTPGRHDIEFKFGSSFSYARNNATFLEIENDANIIFQGSQASVQSGNSLTVGSFNGDQYPDLAISSSDSSGPGRIDVFYGPLKNNDTLSIHEADITFVGIFNGDLENAFISSNNDTFVIGAPNAKSSTGQVFLVNVSSGISGTFNLTNANATINGTAPSGELGKRISISKNVRESGELDVIISAPGNGTVYSVYDIASLNGDFLVDELANRTFSSETNDQFGEELVFGFPDEHSIAIAAPEADTHGLTDNGVVYVYFNVYNGTENLTTQNANVTIYGNRSNLKIGEHFVSTSGDRTLAAGKFRSITRNDLAIGVKNADPFSGGLVAVIYNISTDMNQTINISDANLTVFGNKSLDLMGSVAFGDLNNDYYDDLIVASPGSTVAGVSTAGEAYAFYGGSSLPSSYNVSSANITVSGNQSDANLGTSITVADIDADNWKDLIVGVPGLSAGGNSSAGGTFVFFSEDVITGCGANIGVGEVVSGNFGDFLRNGTVLVKNDLYALPGTDCIDVVATNFTLDCQGYNILGDGPLTATAFDAVGNLNNQTIKNCVVENFKIGILTGAGSAINLSIINNTFNKTGNATFGVFDLAGTSPATDFNFSGNTVENASVGIAFSIGTTATSGEISFNTFRGMGDLSLVDSGSTKSAGITPRVLTGQFVSNISVFNNTFVDGHLGIYLSSNMRNFSIYNNNFTNNADHIVDLNAFGENVYTKFDPGINAQRGNTYDDLTSLAIFDLTGDETGDTGANYPYNFSNGANVNGSVHDTAPWPVFPYVNMTVNKTDSPDPAFSGGTVEYSININANISTNTSAVVTVNETYPPQTTFSSSEPSPSVGNNIWHIEINETGVYTLNVTLNINPGLANATVINNTVEINYTNSSGSVEFTNYTENTTTETIRDVDVIKDASIRGFTLNGTQFLYYINLNATLSEATNVSVNETFPPYITILSSAPAPTISPNYWLVELNETGTFTINVSVLVNSTTPNGTSLFNNVSINYTNISSSNEFKNDSLNIISVTHPRYFNSTADNITISKFDNKDPVLPEEYFTYTIQIENLNTYLIYVNLTENYDPNVRYVSAVPSPTFSNNTWEFNVSAQSNSTINITVQTNSGVANRTMMENLVNVSILDVDGEPLSPLAALENTTVVENVTEFPMYIEDLANISKDDYRDPAFIGQQLTYNITVQNLASDSRDFVVTDVYPSGVIFSNSSPSPDIGNNTWNLNLTAYQNYTINITVNITANISNGSVINNIANLSWKNTSLPHEPIIRISDDEDTTIRNATTYNSQNGITIIKTDDPDPVDSQANLDYTITITNNNVTFNGTVVENFDPRAPYISSEPPQNSTDTWEIEFQNNSIYQINITVGPVSASSGSIIQNLVSLTYSDPITSSNTTLSTVEDTTITPSGGGGGGGGGGGKRPPFPPTCQTSWTCTSWSPNPCLEGSTQTRSCVDINDCGYGRPEGGESRLCEDILEEEEIDDEEQVSGLLPELITLWFWHLWFLVIIALIVIVLSAVYVIKKKDDGAEDEEEKEEKLKKEKIKQAKKTENKKVTKKYHREKKIKIRKERKPFISPDFLTVLKKSLAPTEKSHRDYKAILDDLDSELKEIDKDIKRIRKKKK